MWRSITKRHSAFPGAVFVLFILLSCSKSEDTGPCSNGFTLERDRQVIDSFLRASDRQTSFTFDPTEGLYYFIETPGTGTNTPTIDSLVSFRFTGRLLDGTLVDSGRVETPPTRPLRETGQGLYAIFALTRLTKGGRIQVIIPSSKAFGCMAVIGLKPVPPNSQLIYAYELTDMKRSY